MEKQNFKEILFILYEYKQILAKKIDYFLYSKT